LIDSRNILKQQHMSFFQKLDTNQPATSGENNTIANERTRCLIIGSGPAGYTAAIYAARANLKPLLYKGLQPGGQLTTTTDIENFPGYPEGIEGPKMMEDLEKQAARFGTDIRWGIAVSVDFSSYPRKVILDDKKVIEADTVIIATGATAKYLGLPSEEKYMGSGVSACATCDGFFYKGKDVAVVGAGDSACEEAMYLAGLCNKVYMIVRKPYLRASKIMQERLINTPNIEVLFERNTKEIRGDQVVQEAVLIKKLGTPEEQEEIIKIDGFFLAIGHNPNSDIFKPYIDLDETGYIKTIPGTSKTNVPGVFACGDVQDPHYRQAVTAAGSGCMAAIDAERYLSQLG
jgi:thioredoxin reductase (NADPH)